MTLQDLFDGGVTLQGNVCLSVWRGDEEASVREILECDDLSAAGLDGRTKERDIKYIFAPGDGYLHIELEEE